MSSQVDAISSGLSSPSKNSKSSVEVAAPLEELAAALEALAPVAPLEELAAALAPLEELAAPLEEEAAPPEEALYDSGGITSNSMACIILEVDDSKPPIPVTAATGSPNTGNTEPPPSDIMRCPNSRSV